MRMPAAALAIAAISCFTPVSTLAESLRCTAGTASEGDSRLSLLYKCGPPVLSDSFCAPVYYAGTLNLAPDFYVGAVVPCQQTEELIYERGEGNLVATVRVRSGVIRSISYGRAPR